MTVQNRLNREKFMSVRQRSKTYFPPFNELTQNASVPYKKDLHLAERLNFVEFETRIHQGGVTQWLAFAVARVLRESGRADTVLPS